MKNKILFLIDPLEKLNIKKDSSIFWAISLKKLGHEVFLIFVKDFYVQNTTTNLSFKVYDFEGRITSDLYIDHLTVVETKRVDVGPGDTILMRLDPPFNEAYLHALWLLEFCAGKGITISNSAKGILQHQEKLAAYKLPLQETIPSFVGLLGDDSLNYLNKLMEEGYKEFIIKPLNSFSGIGVFKFSSSENFTEYLHSKRAIIKDYFVLQPFMEKIYEGEIRSIYWRGQEIGSILKKPKEGTFLANIAQGGKFSKIHLPIATDIACTKIAKELLKDGIDLIAYDILDGKISEVNVTCPGLVVETSHAYGENIASKHMLF